MTDDLPEYREPVEVLAEAFHDAWMDWSKTLAENEELTLARVNRWEGYWVPYDELDEEVKDYDRKYARDAIRALEDNAMARLRDQREGEFTPLRDADTPLDAGRGDDA